MDPQSGDDKPHVPGPSLWPVGFAIGIACILVGLVVNPMVVIPIGVVIAAVFGFLWIREASREVRGPVEEVEPETRKATEPAASEAEALRLEPSVDRFPRNKFLEASTIGLGAVIAGIVTVPALGFSILPAFTTKQREDEIDLGAIDQFPEGKFVIATFLLNPAVGEVSRRTAYVRNNGLKSGEPSFTILSNSCVHLGCPVQANGLPLDDETKTTRSASGGELKLTPVEATAGFGCPCHGGQYDTEGNRTAGPPVRSLDRYAFSIRNGSLILLETFSVGNVDGEGADATITAYSQVNPGVHVDGIEALLYPFDPPIPS